MRVTPFICQIDICPASFLHSTSLLPSPVKSPVPTTVIDKGESAASNTPPPNCVKPFISHTAV